MNFINAFIYKEMIELFRDYKKLLIISPIVLLPFIVLLGGQSLIAMSMSKKLNFLFLLVALSTSGQLSLNLFTKEKKEGTLEIIMNDNVHKYSFVIGKLIPTSLSGIVYLFISILLFKLATFINITKDISYEINFVFILTCILVSFLSSAITLFANIIIQDERFTPYIVLIIVTAILFIFRTSIDTLMINSYFPILFCLCGLIIFSLLSIFLLRNKNIVFK